MVKVVDQKNKETQVEWKKYFFNKKYVVQAEDLEGEVFLEKYSYHGQTLDVLVFHQETEKISQNVSSYLFTDSLFYSWNF